MNTDNLLLNVEAIPKYLGDLSTRYFITALYEDLHGYPGYKPQILKEAYACIEDREDEFTSLIRMRDHEPMALLTAELFWPNAGITESLHRVLTLHNLILQRAYTNRASLTPRLVGQRQIVLLNYFTRLSVPDSWRTFNVVALAKAYHVSGDIGLLPILSDALQDAGCEEKFNWVWLPKGSRIILELINDEFYQRRK